MQRRRSAARARRALRGPALLALAAEFDRRVLRFASLMQVALAPVAFVPTAIAELSRAVELAEAVETTSAMQTTTSVAASATQRLLISETGMRSPHRTSIRVFPGVHLHLDVCMSAPRFLHVRLRKYHGGRFSESAAHSID